MLMNPEVWVASGHIGGFNDPLMDCKSCKERFRADKLIEDYMKEHGIAVEEPVDAWSQARMKAYIDEQSIPCPSCGKHDFTDCLLYTSIFHCGDGYMPLQIIKQGCPGAK